MHKLKAVLAPVTSVRPGDKVHLGGRGPWPRIKEVRRYNQHNVLLAGGNKKTVFSIDAFVRVIRDA